MSFISSHLLHLTAVLALAANACSGAVARPVATLAPLGCSGGVVSSAADAVRFGVCGTVQGDLRISAADLTDLTALAGLRSVSGTLEIAGNPQLDDLSGLERLGQVGALVVRDNADLDDLTGLEGLTRTGRLVIEHNGLNQTTGISNLVDVGELVIRDNPKLHSLHGFRSLSHARSVDIQGNPWLCARGILPSLTRVEQSMTVTRNRGMSKSDVQELLGRIERGLAEPAEGVGQASREASL